MSGDVRDLSNIETVVVNKLFFSLQGKTPKKIHAILKETLGEHAPSYATVKSLNGVIFPLVMHFVLDDPKQ